MTTYNWKIPHIEGFNLTGHSGYEPNIELKKYLKALWDQAPDDIERLKIAKIIVSDWGGVRANEPDTLMEYVNRISEKEPPSPLQGIASYSKIFAIVDPHRYAIYDARVAACLNAIQINANLTNGLTFNYVQGRNNVVGHATKKIGFTQDVRFSTKQLIKYGWSEIKRGDTYLKYLGLLNYCLMELPGYSLTSLEMALFANAEIECMKAMTSDFDACDM